MKEQNKESIEALNKAISSESKIQKEMADLEGQRMFEINSFNHNIDELKAQIEGLKDNLA